MLPIKFDGNGGWGHHAEALRSRSGLRLLSVTAGQPVKPGAQERRQTGKEPQVNLDAPAGQSNRQWDDVVGSWHRQVGSSPGFAQVRDALLEAAAPSREDQCADLGAGTGLITFPLAERAGHVFAIDASAGMAKRLQECTPPGLRTRVQALVADVATLDLAEGSLDLIVSGYTLHHLTHPDKRALMRGAFHWLAPGGRLVIADMMFGRGGTPEDRQILAGKIKALAGKGPGGWLRIAKNAARFGLGVGAERPASPEFWRQALRDAGFAGVRYQRIVAEAGLVSGFRP